MQPWKFSGDLSPDLFAGRTHPQESRVSLDVAGASAHWYVGSPQTLCAAAENGPCREAARVWSLWFASCVTLGQFPNLSALCSFMWWL